MRVLLRLLLLIMAVSMLQGCAMGPRFSSSQNLSSILEPVKDSLASQDKKPLVFPAAVGILMVPPPSNHEIPGSTLHLAAQELKKELLKNEKYVKAVSIVSASDFKEKITLNQISDLYGVDVLVIVSFEQDQRRVQNSVLALMNIAIVPAFIIPGVEVITSSIVDGKIVHIPSNAIIFRAGGLDERTENMTPFSAEGGGETEESIVSLASSVSELGKNISKILAGMEKIDPSTAVSMNNVIEDASRSANADSGGADGSGKNWEKVDAYKRAGGGSISILELLGLAGLLLGFLRGVPVVKEG